MDNFYADWRRQRQLALVLRDDTDLPPEKLLQAVWRHQRIRRDHLKTVDGRTLRVLHPGFGSHEGGPDFRGAVLRFGDSPPVTGEVEIDLQPGGWRAHGHDRNPSFKQVILHVVWETPNAASSPLAMLALKPVLDAPVSELAQVLDNDTDLLEEHRGKCSAPLRELPLEQLTALLQGAARVRFENKAAAILARAKNGGWEQSLWEQIFRAMGYKNNTWPMQNLAETKPQWASGAASVFDLQTRLLGVGGLLPPELTRAQKSSDTFLRRAWDSWWRDRDTFESCLLPREVWRFHGLRPANHPQRRLALAAHWLADGKLVQHLENWIATTVPSSRLVDSLFQIFQIKRDEFWSWHFTFKSERLAKPQPLLGEGRVTDLAVNVVLPWLWVRAKEGGNDELQREAEQRYLAWPAAEDNSVLKLARQRLLGTAKTDALKTAARQQGLMQIVRDFCEHSDAICTNCRFPELVRNFPATLVKT